MTAGCIQGAMSISNDCSTEFEECFRFPRKQTLGHRCQCRRLLGSDDTCQGVREAGMGTAGRLGCDTDLSIVSSGSRMGLSICHKLKQ